MIDLLKKKAYYYKLPKHLIAQYPLTQRDHARMLVVNRNEKTIFHDVFYNIINYLTNKDLLIVNKSRVIPARLYAYKDTGAKLEVLLLNKISDLHWQCIIHPEKRIKHPQTIFFSEKVKGYITQPNLEGIREIHFSCQTDFNSFLSDYGHVPLPPYIKRGDEQIDKTEYQTVFAKEEGSVAAPTAGLHFTNELVHKIKLQGIKIAEITLHVSLGTFRPVKTDIITNHKMHAELCEINEESANLINHTKSIGGRIIAVGTTSARTLESFFENGKIQSGRKWTDIFIYPGVQYKVVDAMITNFHLPESTLLMMISAFGGYELIMKAYREAVSKEYRFFSYGDSMLIF